MTKTICYVYAVAPLTLGRLGAPVKETAMGWFTSQEDKNNKDYAEGYKLGRSNNFLEDAARDVVTTLLPIGGNDIFEKGYEEGQLDRLRHGSGERSGEHKSEHH